MKFNQITPMGRDGTARYEVVLGQPITVRDFVASILNDETEWGWIYVDDDTDDLPYIPFSKGKLEHELFPVPRLDANVSSVKAVGGLGRMDYYITTIK